MKINFISLVMEKLSLNMGDVMKHRKTKLLTLLASAMALVSCDNTQPISTIVEVGFNEYYGLSNPTSQVGLAFTAENEQSLSAIFNVYIGARKGFTEDWQKDLWGCNPGYGKFAINRIIEDETGNELQNDFIVLDDFPNDEKYPLTYKAIKGTVDGVKMQYETFMKDTIDFRSFDVSRGSIGYYICYYDDVNQKPFEENCYLYGISWGGQLNFEKNDKNVIFSK